MSIHDNVTPPTPEEIHEFLVAVLTPRPYRYDPRDEFEPDVAHWSELGVSRDDEECADRAADREWAARWER